MVDKDSLSYFKQGFEAGKEAALMEFKSGGYEPVVHCGECRYQHLINGYLHYCTIWDSYNGLGDDGFCNYGAKMEV